MKKATIFFIFFSAIPVRIFATEALIVYYMERPPYIITTGDDKVEGLTGKVTLEALEKAKIPFTLEKMPPPRQLEYLKANKSMACGIGWFKNPEREEFAKFTKSLYQDGPQHALISANQTLIKEGDSLESILSNKKLVILTKIGYSYGKTLDEMMKQHDIFRSEVTLENDQMVKMVQMGRANYMFMSKEEGEPLLAAMGIKPSVLKLVRLEGTPKGDHRYLMCSRMTSDEIIAKINAHLK